LFLERDFTGRGGGEGKKNKGEEVRFHGGREIGRRAHQAELFFFGSG
jgi:hypothetical protein